MRESISAVRYRSVVSFTERWLELGIAGAACGVSQFSLSRCMLSLTRCGLADAAGLGFWVLLTEMTRGESATGTFCPKCPTHHPADCNINENSRTITCVVNTTTCDLVQCTNDDRCFIHFFNSTTGDFWTLASLCAHFDGEGPCLLEPSYEGSNAFPPPNGMECRCTVNCSLDRPLVYVHPFPPDEVSSLVSSIRPSVTPTNDTCGECVPFIKI